MRAATRLKMILKVGALHEGTDPDNVIPHFLTRIKRRSFYRPHATRWKVLNYVIPADSMSKKKYFVINMDHALTSYRIKYRQ